MKKETSEKDVCSVVVLEIAIAIGVMIVSCMMSKKEKREET